MRAKKKLNNAMALADASRNYRKAIGIFNKYSARYNLPADFKYKYGMLYDHLAIKIIKKGKRGRYISRYLDKAENLYKEALIKDPGYLLGFRGLARVYEVRKKYKVAIKYALTAYKLWRKLPRNKKGALGIGSFYEVIGDYKNAEKWYKRELKELGDKDIGAVFNIFMFYKRVGEKDKANAYGKKAVPILVNMFGAKNLTRLKKSNKTVNFMVRELENSLGVKIWT